MISQTTTLDDDQRNQAKGPFDVRTRAPWVAKLTLTVAIAIATEAFAATGGVAAATGSTLIDTTSFSISTTGALASGKAQRTQDTSGTYTYAVGFTLADAGNDGRPVYFRWRYSVLVNGAGGLFWNATAIQTFFNSGGYPTSVNGTIRMTEAQVNTIPASLGSGLPAVKFRVEIGVCRGGATPNCSAWWSQTWNTYPILAFTPMFECLGPGALVQLSTFVKPGYVPMQGSPFVLAVKGQMLESSDSAFSVITNSYPTDTYLIQYPNPLAIATLSNVYRVDSGGTLVPTLGSFGATLRAGYYYAFRFEVIVSSAGALPAAGEQPTYAWAWYTIQNGFAQGTPGDFKCLARP